MVFTVALFWVKSGSKNCEMFRDDYSDFPYCGGYLVGNKQLSQRLLFFRLFVVIFFWWKTFFPHFSRWFFFLIAKYGSKWTELECRTFLTPDCKGNWTDCHIVQLLSRTPVEPIIQSKINRLNSYIK